MSIKASYLVPAEPGQYDPSQYVPELSRRARGFAVWALLRALGRQGIADMVRTHCELASQLATKLDNEQGIEVFNDVVLNQVMFAFWDQEPDGDCQTKAVIERLGRDNRFLALGAEWKGRSVLRISIISPATDEATIDTLAEAILGAWTEVRTANQKAGSENLI